MGFSFFLSIAIKMYKISFYVVLFSLSTYSSSALLIPGFGWQAYRSGIHRVSMRLYIWLARRSSHFAIFAIKWVAAMQMGRLRKLHKFSILIVHTVALLFFLGFLSFFFFFFRFSAYFLVLFLCYPTIGRIVVWHPAQAQKLIYRQQFRQWPRRSFWKLRIFMTRSSWANTQVVVVALMRDFFGIRFYFPL